MKPKILKVENEVYPTGRIDSFKISEENGAFEKLISCLVEFGFSEESIRNKVDFTLENRGYSFYYLNSGLKVHLSAEESGDFFTIRFDNSLDREKLIQIIEKYFEFSE